MGISIQTPAPALVAGIQQCAAEGRSPLDELRGCIPPDVELVEQLRHPLPGLYWWVITLQYPGSTAPAYLVCRQNFSTPKKGGRRP